MALRHFYFGEYSSCLKLLDTSFNIFQNIYHKKYPFLSSLLHHQSLTLLSSGMDYKAAIRAIKKSLLIRRTAYGEESLPTAESYYLQGRWECDRGNYSQSEESLLKALGLMCKCHGINLIAVARVKDSLGKLYTLLSRYDEARICLNESLAIRRDLLLQSSDIEGHEGGDDEEKEGKEDEKETLRSELAPHFSIPVQASAGTETGAEMGDTYTLLAELALTQHNWSEAEMNCLKSIEIYEKYFVDICPHHPKLLNSRGDLGLIYLLSKKRGEGEHDYQKEGERLIDESLRRLLYGDGKEKECNGGVAKDQDQEQPSYHSYHHPWIKKFQLRYCLPASHPSSPRGVPTGIDARVSTGALTPVLNDQTIESNLLYENYQLRSKNDELQRLLQGLQSQLQTLQTRLQDSEEMHHTNQEMIRSLKAQLATGGRGGAGKVQSQNPPLAIFSSSNYLPKETLEQREGIPMGTGGSKDDDDDEESSNDYLPKIGTIAKTLGYAKRTFAQSKKYQSPTPAARR